jgi:hypothetical protein
MLAPFASLRRPKHHDERHHGQADQAACESQYLPRSPVPAFSDGAGAMIFPRMWFPLLRRVDRDALSGERLSVNRQFPSVNRQAILGKS